VVLARLRVRESIGPRQARVSFDFLLYYTVNASFRRVLTRWVVITFWRPSTVLALQCFMLYDLR